jgi:hypothetical protein
MHWDSVHTFIAAYLLDLAKSVYLEEWHGEGAPDLKEAVQRCLHTIKISNARRLLEGHEPFCHKFGNSPDDSDTRGELSIAQVAMLAGMEEMSLRSAISRKTAPVLKIEKDERRTYIDAEVAKEWLKAKKRYIPVRKGRRHQDFSTTAFRSVGEFVAALEDRAAVAGDEDPSAAAQLTAALAVKGKAALSDLVDTDVADEPLLTAVAQALKLPADLVRYRANEALLQSDIEWRQHQLRALRAGKPDTAS